jgi:hypothetical protein
MHQVENSGQGDDTFGRVLFPGERARSQPSGPLKSRPQSEWNKTLSHSPTALVVTLDPARDERRHSTNSNATHSSATSAIPETHFFAMI